jgi:hypothetical protein
VARHSRRSRRLDATAQVTGLLGGATTVLPRELFARMQLGRYPDPSGDEFDLFNAIADEVQWPKVWAGDGLARGGNRRLAPLRRANRAPG